MTDDRILDISDKINSIEYCIEEGIDREIVEEELKSYDWFLNSEIKKYYRAYNKLTTSDMILHSKKITEGVKKKLLKLMSMIYKVEKILDNYKDV